MCSEFDFLITPRPKSKTSDSPRARYEAPKGKQKNRPWAKTVPMAVETTTPIRPTGLTLQYMWSVLTLWDNSWYTFISNWCYKHRSDRHTTALHLPFFSTTLTHTISATGQARKMNLTILEMAGQAWHCQGAKKYRCFHFSKEKKQCTLSCVLHLISI